MRYHVCDEKHGERTLSEESLLWIVLSCSHPTVQCEYSTTGMLCSLFIFITIITSALLILYGSESTVSSCLFYFLFHSSSRFWWYWRNEWIFLMCDSMKSISVSLVNEVVRRSELLACTPVSVNKRHIVSLWKLRVIHSMQALLNLVRLHEKNSVGLWVLKDLLNWKEKANLLLKLYGWTLSSRFLKIFNGGSLSKWRIFFLDMPLDIYQKDSFFVSFLKRIWYFYLLPHFNTLSVVLKL